MSLFQTHILTEAQREVLAEIGPFTADRGFYLAGGTAVALRLGHRLSEDFDWFASTPSTVPESIQEELTAAGFTAITKEVSPGTYHGQVAGVNVTFLRYRYAMLEPPQLWDEYGCRVATLSDLACMKLSALSQRSDRKDFVDIDAILNQGSSLAELLSNYRRKYNISDIVPVLYGLNYFDEAERTPMPKMLKLVDWKAIKQNLQRAVRQMMLTPPSD